MSKQIIEEFYEAFSRHDYQAMSELYHPQAQFYDPVFDELSYGEVTSMWEMLIKRSKGDLKITHHSVITDSEKGHCIWEAKYPFSKTGRNVHNVIHATMEFQDGLIILHIDNFNFWKWSSMALGVPGILLGWSPIIRNKVKSMARKSLDDFIK